MSRYAEGTDVSVEKSLMEIKKTLQRFNAERFGYMEEPDRLLIGFSVKGLNIQMFVSLPPISDYQFSANRRTARSQETQMAEWQKEVRRRTRSLTAVIKAKLIAIDDKIATIEQEFLPYIVMSNGMTIGDALIPVMQQQLAEGKPLALGAGE